MITLSMMDKDKRKTFNPNRELILVLTIMALVVGVILTLSGLVILMITIPAPVWLKLLAPGVGITGVAIKLIRKYG